MDKHKARKNFVRVLLVFVVFLYIFSLAVLLFGDPQAGIALFAYNTFFTVVVYFLAMWQKRIENAASYENSEDTKDN